MFPFQILTNITGFNPFKEMNDFFGMPSFNDTSDDATNIFNPFKILTGLDPFNDKNDIFGMPDFNDTMDDPLFSLTNSSANNPLDNIISRALSGMVDDDDLTSVQNMSHQGNDDRTSTVTKIVNGHAVQETKTCKAGKCTTEKHEFDVPADRL